MSLSVASSQFVFCDLQPVLLQQSRTVEPALITQAVSALAQAAHRLGCPISLALVPLGGQPGHPIPALAAYVEAGNSFQRSIVDPFCDPAFSQHLAAQNRPCLILAGVSVEAAVLQTGLAALAAGYQVYIPVDAIGSRHARTEAAALRELERAGAVISSVRSVLLRLTPDLSAAPGLDILALLADL